MAIADSSAAVADISPDFSDENPLPFRGSGLSPQQFFAVVEGLFAQAAHRFAPIEYSYRIAGQSLRLVFASEVLRQRIAPALCHNELRHNQIECETRDDELVVMLWDSASSGVEMPITPWDNTEYFVRNEIRGYSDARFRTTFHMGSGVLSMLDIESKRAILWIRDARDLPYYESGAPLLAILHAWMSTRSRHLVHAAAIGKQSGGVLLVGRGGSGKSSTALQTFGSNLQYAADDYCIVANADSDFRAFSCYSSGKVHASDVAHFGHLHSCLSNQKTMHDEKALFFLGDTWRHKLIDNFPIRAILLPRVTNSGAPHFVPLSRAQALLALAPSTIFQLPNAGRETFDWLSHLVKNIPAFTLHLGAHRSDVLPAIEGFLKENYGV